MWFSSLLAVFEKIEEKYIANKYLGCLNFRQKSAKFESLERALLTIVVILRSLLF